MIRSLSRPGPVLAAILGLAVSLILQVSAAAAADNPVGVVSHVKVLSDKVRDVSSLEAWKRSFIRDGMTDEQKAIAVWRSVVMHRYQDSPPIEFLHEGCVHDPIKTFNVYGYGMCCCASANIEALARYVGLDARGWAIRLHSVPEVFYDNAWHMFDASLVNYFPKPDGKIASVEEIVAAVQGLAGEAPGVPQATTTSWSQFHRAGGWLGWKQGPELLTRCPFYDWSRLVAGQDARLVLDHAGVRRRAEHAVHLRVRLLAGLRSQHPAAARRAADAELVPPGSARQRDPQGRRRPGLPEREDRRRLDGLPAAVTAT